MKKIFIMLMILLTSILIISGCKKDNQPPLITIDNDFIIEYEVGTNEPDWLQAIFVEDEVDGIITLSNNDIDISNVNMNNVGQFDVIYNIKDSKGNLATQSITITIVDTTNPVITGLTDLSFEVTTEEPNWLDGVTVTDNYDNDITLTMDNVDTSNVDMNTVGSFNVIYTVTDTNNNTVTQSISVTIIDSIPPTINGLTDLSFEVNSEEPNWLNGVTVTDNYDNEITLTIDNVDNSNVDMNTIGTFNVIYTVTDVNNNTTTQSITITIVDTTNPVITGLTDLSFEVTTEEPNWLDGVTVTDNYDNDITLTMDNVDTSNVDMNTVGTFNVIYTVTDTNNNTVTQSISVTIIDTIPPTINGLTDLSFEVGSEEPNWLDGITVTDNYDNEITLTIDNVDNSNVDMNTIGTFNVIYTVTDVNNNTTTQSITITIVDTTNPVITGLTDLSFEVTTEEPNWLDGVTVTDNYDNDITLTMDNVDTSNVDMNTVGTFNVIYTVTDTNNNTVIQSISVTIVDTIPPVINGLTDLSFEVGSEEPNWLDGITVTDNYDNEITLTIDNVDTINVEMNTVGTFNVIYTVTDVNNNTTTQSITITIVVDKTNPIINGLTDLSFEVNSEEPNWLDGITVTDNYDNEITLTTDNVDTSNVDMNTLGTFNVIYTVTDTNNNTTTQSITITIIDTIPPTINGLTDLSFEVNSEEPNWLNGVTVTDNYDNDITLTIDNVDNSNVDMNTIGTFNVIYTVTDVNNNTTTQSITITIVDTTPPEITLVGGNQVELYLGQDYTELGCLAIDTYEGDISHNVEIIGNVDTNYPGVYSLTYKVTDTSGNSNQVTRTINVIDDLSFIITDDNLEILIRAHLGITLDQPITLIDALSIDILDGEDSNITNLNGIEFFTNITNLCLYINGITDITPLSNLTNLIFLDLGDNLITDISILVNLTNLETILLDDTFITDITCLTSLYNLQELWILNAPIDFTEGSPNYIALNVLHDAGVNIDIYDDIMLPTS